MEWNTILITVGLATAAVIQLVRTTYTEFVKRTTVFIDEQHVLTESFTRRGRSAVVVGGSMAGCMAAKVLLCHYDNVTLIESENIQDLTGTDWATPRKDVLQASSSHFLQPLGCRLLEALFPGIRKYMVEHGGIPINCSDGQFWLYDNFFARVPKDRSIDTVAASRSLYEGAVRSKLLQGHEHSGRLTYRKHVTVQHLHLGQDGAVASVTCYDKTTKETFVLDADIVVDATGRSAKGRKWVKETAGVEVPEDTYDPLCQYSTMMFEKTGPLPPYVVTAPYPGGTKRESAVAVVVEGNHAQVTLMKVADKVQSLPKTDAELDAFFDRISVDWPFWKDVRQSLGKRCSEYNRIKLPPSRFCRYDQIAVPHGFVAVGDAFCGFNPFYGQGMTTSAIAAVTLSSVLLDPATTHTTLSSKFHTLLRTRLLPIWVNNEVADLASHEVVPCSGRSRSDSDLRFLTFLSKVLFQAAHIDQKAALCLSRGLSLVQWPHELLEPAVLWAVFKAAVLGEKPPSGRWVYKNGIMTRVPAS
ncbi:hypothetical protein HKX48_002713 [Thoreauomyces humboldtii]|nr:hypothetical protein HKX48_002713 [Thoreauomyces humboldtii]